MNSNVESELTVLRACLNDDGMRNVFQAKSCIETLKNIIPNVYDDAELDFVCASLFHPKTGITAFVEEALKNKKLNDISILTLDFLLQLVQQCTRITSKDDIVKRLWRLCSARISQRWTPEMKIRKVAHEIIISLVKNPRSRQCLREHFWSECIVDKLLENLEGRTAASKEVFGKTCELLGSIFEHYPDIIRRDDPKRIFRLALSNAGNLVDQVQQHGVSFEGCFLLLGNILKNFPETLTDENRSKAYGLLKEVIARKQRGKELPRLCLAVIRDHAALFEDELYADSEWWDSLLEEWLDRNDWQDYQVAKAAAISFYKRMGEKMTSDGNGAEKLEKFEEKILHRVVSFENEEAAKYCQVVLTTIESLASFVEAFKKFGKRNVLFNIYKKILYYLDFSSARWTREDHSNLPVVANCLTSITEIFRYFPDIYTQEDTASLQKLTTRILEWYPNVAERDRRLYIKALMQAIVNMAGSDVFDDYLHFMYLAIGRSCDHAIQSNIDGLKLIAENGDAREMGKALISYKAYAPIWKSICGVRGMAEVTAHPTIKLKTSERLYDKFVEYSFSLIEKLNLNITDEETGDKAVSSAIEYGARPCCDFDVNIFINLTDLFCDVVVESDGDRFEKWMPAAISNFTHLAGKFYPKSEFFKLLTATFKVARKTKYFQRDLQGKKCLIKDTKLFLSDVISNLKTYKNADLIAALQLTTNAPVVMIVPFLKEMTAAFQILFAFGNVSLASEALKILFRWHEEIPAALSKPFLREIFPYLEPYLKSDGAADGGDLTEREKTLLQRRWRGAKGWNTGQQHFCSMREAYALSRQTELRTFKEEIAAFMGRLDSDVCSALVTATRVAGLKEEDVFRGEMSEILNFPLPYPDAKIPIYLDSFLPRVTRLALTCADVKTRVTAGELFHSICVVFVKDARSMETSYGKSAASLFKRILPVMLKLGSDNYPPMRQLFRPLSLQFARYYSSYAQRESPITAAMMEILFENLSNDMDAAARDFSAECLREFAAWSLKQTANERDETEAVNVRAIARLICSYSQNADPYKRLGAALAFNNVYRDLRESKPILDQFWLELLFHFVGSLEISRSGQDAVDVQIALAVKNIRRVLVEKPQLFQRESPLRRTPNALGNGTLKDVLEWLLHRCLSFKTACRRACMALIEDLIPISGIVSMEKYLNDSEEQKGKCFFKGNLPQILNTAAAVVEESADRIFYWIRMLDALLDCYVWLLEKRVLPFDRTLKRADFELWKNLELFLREFALVKKLSLKEPLGKAREATFERVKARIIYGLFSFLRNVTMNLSEIQLFRMEEFRILIQTCLFEPTEFSFDLKSSWNLPNVLMEALGKLRGQPEILAPLLARLKNYIRATATGGNMIRFCSVDDIADACVKQHLDGLCVLKLSGILDGVFGDDDGVVGKSKRLLQNIFDDVCGRNEAKELTAANVGYYNKLVSFAVGNAEADFVLDLILNVEKSAKPNITKGSHFYKVFKRPLIEAVVSFHRVFICRCFQNGGGVDKYAVATLTRILTDGKNCIRRPHTAASIAAMEDLSSAVVSNWDILADGRSNFSTAALFDILHAAAVSVNVKNNGEWGQEWGKCALLWLLNELEDESAPTAVVDHFTKINVFKYISAFSSSGVDRFDDVIENVLSRFGKRYFQGKEGMSREERHTISLICEATQTALKTSSSRPLLKFVADSAVATAAGNAELFFTDLEGAVGTYIRNLAPAYQLEALRGIFDEAAKGNDDASRVKLVLVPGIEATHGKTLRDFFREIYPRMMDAMAKRQPEANEDRVVVEKFLKSLSEILISMEIMLEKLTARKIWPPDDNEEREGGSNINNNNLKKDLKSAVRILAKTDFPQHHRRLCWHVRCRAYNVSLKILTKCDDARRYEEFYRDYCFSRGTLERIANADEDYKLPLVLDKCPGYKKRLVSVRGDLKAAGVVEYRVSTQCLSNSSLSGDFEAFDMQDKRVLDENEADGNELSKELDFVDLGINGHECMVAAIDTVQFLAKRDDDSHDGTLKMPNWMSSLRKTVLASNVKNVKLFAIALVYNCRSIFRPYAEYWMQFVMNAVIARYYGDGINYTVHDLILMLLDWSEIALPISPLDADRANNLLKFVTNRIDVNVAAMRKLNLKLAVTLMETWMNCINVDAVRSTLMDFLSSSSSSGKGAAADIGVIFAKCLLRRNLAPYVRERKDEFLRALLSLIGDKAYSTKDDQSLFEAAAMVAHFFRNGGMEEDLKAWSVNLRATLDGCQKNFNNFLPRLRCMLEFYPEIAKGYAGYVAESALPIVKGVLKKDALKIVLNCLEEIPKGGSSFALLLSNLKGFLRETDYSARALTMRIVVKLSETSRDQDCEEMTAMLKDVAGTDRKCPEFRSLVYDMAKILRSRFPRSKDLADKWKEIACAALSDEDDDLRGKAFEDAVPLIGTADVTTVFENVLSQAYSPAVETAFLKYGVELLLHPTTSTPDFNEKLSDQPLDRCCTFRDLKIMKSWRARNMSVPPMFVNTLQSQFDTISADGYYSLKIQATRFTLEFSRTLDDSDATQSSTMAHSIVDGTADATVSEIAGSLTEAGSSVQSSGRFVDRKEGWKSKLASKRMFVKWDAKAASRAFADRNVKRNEIDKAMLRERARRKEGKVDILRNYRVGDFPDIEIPVSAVVVPLRALAKRDNATARQTFVAIFKGIRVKAAERGNERFVRNMERLLRDMMEGSSECGNSFMGALLEIAFESPEITFDPNQTAMVAQSSGLLSLGCLLLEGAIKREEDEPDDEPSIAKKARPAAGAETHPDHLWMKLSSVYRSMGEGDAVNGIFAEKINTATSNAVREIWKLEQRGDWTAAERQYLRILEEKGGGSGGGGFADENDERFVREAYYKCARNLGNWDKLTENIHGKYPNLEDVWKDQWSREFSLPWLFDAETRNVLSTPSRAATSSLSLSEENTERFKRAFEEWTEDGSNNVRKDYIIGEFGEQAAMILCREGKLEKAKMYGNKSAISMLADWADDGNGISSASLSAVVVCHDESRRLEKMRRLQTMAEINECARNLDYYYSRTGAEDTRRHFLFDVLSKNTTPSKTDSLFAWTKRVCYRNYFLDNWCRAIDGSSIGGRVIVRKASALKAELRLRLIDEAIGRRNYDVAAKNFAVLFDGDANCNVLSLDLKTELQICCSKLFALQADKRKSSQYFTAAWSKLLAYSTADGSDSDLVLSDVTKCSFFSHLSDLCEKSADFAGIDYSPYLRKIYGNYMTDVSNVVDNIPPNTSFANGDGGSRLLEALNMACLEKIVEMKSHSDSKEDLARAYLAVAKHCRAYNYGKDTMEYELHILKNILKAMKYGSKEASQLFPTLLQLKHLLSEPLTAAFRDECRGVEKWRFLAWTNQLLANVDTPNVEAIEGLILELAKSYPNALRFPFALSEQSFAYTYEKTKILSQKLRSVLRDNSSTDFAKACSYICIPEFRITHLLRKIIKLWKRGDENSLSLASAIRNDILGVGVDPAMFGPLHKKCSQTFRVKEILEEAESYLNGNKEKSLALLNRLMRNLQETGMNPFKRDAARGDWKGKLLLRNYSPWLADYSQLSRGDLEIPGQYTGRRLPAPEEHAKIYGFKREVSVMLSKQTPIKITIEGSDARRYHYLVKFGEDLRLDQRMQQLFQIINESFQSDPVCNSRKLHLNTYSVIPFTLDLGFIQWVEDGIPMKEFLKYKMAAEDARKHDKLMEWLLIMYQMWLKNAAGKAGIVSGNVIELHHAVAKTFLDPSKRYEILNMFHSLTKKVPNDLLKKSLMKMCENFEVFHKLRATFIRSHCTMSLCHWILGIGDRHLANTLISKTAGTSTGIDFGLSFGLGVQCQMIPEMIPFRMTPMFANLMSPFGLTGFIRETLNHCCDLLKRDHLVLLATMQVFLHEPSLDWLKQAEKIQNARAEGDGDVTFNFNWFPEKTISNVRLKLEGKTNPGKLIEEEIKYNAICPENVKEAYAAVVEEATAAFDPTDQVSSLLNLATNEHVLGLSWGGLNTWI